MTSPEMDKKKRGAYLCSKCGEPKKGHVCKSSGVPTELPPTPAAKKKRKTSLNSPKDEIYVEQTGIVLRSDAPPKEEPKHVSNMQVHMHPMETSSKMATRRPVRLDQDTMEMQNFRKVIAILCNRAHDATLSLKEDNTIFYKRLEKATQDLDSELNKLREKFFPSGHSNALDSSGGQNIEVAKILYSFNDVPDSMNGKGSESGRGSTYKILFYLEIFTEELNNEWPDDKEGLGFKSAIEDKLFQLWDFSLQKLQHELMPQDLVEWALLAQLLDRQGRLKLNLDASEPLKQGLIKNQATIFRSAPSFEMYKSIVERFPHLDQQLLKKELLDVLTLSEPAELKTRLQILIHEKRFQQLKEEVSNIKSNDFIIDAAQQLAPMYPAEIIL